ncbi:hypothetical protein [Dyadobacter sp. LHD-138]|uniref:hypothetical protein n=1 Tax=Dyadobacter sp. LHD-138 TaxID=3071413 RepID=UPI0027E143C2|nr:hypothetical protein [Dyadobacter sp. LHD-138]MDQ6479811.1 hypothetical protein [Dyadobacter sp. LHD-138]
MNRKSLGQLKAVFNAFIGADDKKSATDVKPDKANDSTDAGDDAADDKSDDSKKKEEKKVETETAKDPQGSANVVQGNVVNLSTEDYDMLMSMANSAVSMKEENTALKAKADRWDAYQAALGSGKPAADTAGAKADKASDNQGDDDLAELRKKHGALMADI